MRLCEKRIRPLPQTDAIAEREKSDVLDRAKAARIVQFYFNIPPSFAIRAHYHYHHRKSDYWGGVPRSAQIGAIKGRAGRIGVSWAYDHKSTHHAGVHLIRTEFELGGYTKVGLVRSGRKW